MAKSQTKAKTTKPPVAEKAGGVATNAIAMTQDLRMIPLDQLELSPLNVRKVAASDADDAELLASIRENGIKQNLVVHALSDGKFAVDAGGRRLKALKGRFITATSTEVLTKRMLLLHNARRSCKLRRTLIEQLLPFSYLNLTA